MNHPDTRTAICECGHSENGHGRIHQDWPYECWMLDGDDVRCPCRRYSPQPRQENPT